MRDPALSAVSQQVDAVLEQTVPGLARQGEGAVLGVGHSGVPHRGPLLQEVRFLGRTAGPVNSRPRIPDTQRHALRYVQERDTFIHTLTRSALDDNTQDYTLCCQKQHCIKALYSSLKVFLI